MRALSSAASVSFHAAVAAALLLGTTKTASPNPGSIDTTYIMPEPPGRTSGPTGSEGIVIPTPRVEWSPPSGAIAPLSPALQTGALIPTFSPAWAPGAGIGGTVGNGGEPGFSVSEAAPEVLAGPLPLYPDLLRQAGVEGQVILEARVDSTGRVQKGSVSVVFATHPGFVESARQALMVTLFRPARVNGRAVAMLVRVPFAFSIRGGTGRAR